MFKSGMILGVCCALVASTLGMAGCSAGDRAEGSFETTAESGQFVVEAGKTAVALGVHSWSLDDQGNIRGLSAKGKTIVQFRSLSERKAIESLLPDVGVKELEPDSKKTSFSAAAESAYQAFLTDLKAHAATLSAKTGGSEPGKLTEGLVYSIVVGCCNGCGPTGSAQITKWVGDQYPAGYCHIDYTGYACYGSTCYVNDPMMCWNNTGGCVYWY